MIEVNKNLIQVRDTNTKEFKPLNVLGTFSDVLDEQLNVTSDMGVKNKVISKAIGDVQTSAFKTQMKVTEIQNQINNDIIPNIEKPWSTFQLNPSANRGSTYYFVAASKTPIKTSSSHSFSTSSTNQAYFQVPIDGTIIITINAWMSSSANQNDIGLFIYDYSGNTWYDYSVGGLGVLGETGKANYISITSCPISVIGGHYIQVVAKHHSGDIRVEELNSYGTAYGVPYGNGNTITFRYI